MRRLFCLELPHIQIVYCPRKRGDALTNLLFFRPASLDKPPPFAIRMAELQLLVGESGGHTSLLNDGTNEWGKTRRPTKLGEGTCDQRISDYLEQLNRASSTKALFDLSSNRALSTFRTSPNDGTRFSGKRHFSGKAG